MSLPISSTFLILLVSNRKFNLKCAGADSGIDLQRQQIFQQIPAFLLSRTPAF